MKLTIQPDAALYMINETDWDEDNMTMLRELSLAVENDETLEYEID